MELWKDLKRRAHRQGSRIKVKESRKWQSCEHAKGIEIGAVWRWEKVE